MTVSGLGEHAGLAARAHTLLRLLEASESWHPGLYGHGDAVARHCVSVAMTFGLTPSVLEEIFLAGKLHDIGKAAIDQSVLRKPGPLTEDEWREIRRHPSIGANLHFACGLDLVGDWILAHHERPDGSGYPLGLEDESIPLPAKILAAADAYDAMLTERAYSPALTREQAAAELRAGAGTQFDPEVVEALLSSDELPYTRSITVASPRPTPTAAK